jgi:hypothetical protein
MKSRGEERRAARQRQEDYIRRLIDLTHALDHARLVIRADKTVEAWKEQMIARVIPAYMELRDMYHDQVAIKTTGKPFFREDEEIIQNLRKMSWWFQAFCGEYSRHKELLAGDQQNRLRFSKNYDEGRDLWPRLNLLPFLQDFLLDPEVDPEPVRDRNTVALSDSGTYGDFRAAYADALADMRMEFSIPKKRQPYTSPTSPRSEPARLGSLVAGRYRIPG